MEITHAGGTLYKIGVTSRTAEERALEAAAELRAAGLDGVSIKVFDTWPHRGNVELYFKHRYAAYQQAIGTLTEYFALPPDVLNAVLLDLGAMKPKVPDALEHGMLAGEPAPVEAGQPPYFQRLPLDVWLLLTRAAKAGTPGVVRSHPDFALLHGLYRSRQFSTPHPLFELSAIQGEPAFGVSHYGRTYIERYGAWYQGLITD